MDRAPGKLLGGLRFVTRTFEGDFKENPYVLDMDANLYIGPADGITRDEHSAVEVVYHFLVQSGRVKLAFRDLLRNRLLLLEKSSLTPLNPEYGKRAPAPPPAASAD